MHACSNKGYPVPVYEPVDEVSTGRCSGAEYNSTSYSTTALDPPAEPLVPLKTTREWLRALNQDGFVLASFIVAIISGESASLNVKASANFSCTECLPLLSTLPFAIQVADVHAASLAAGISKVAEARCCQCPSPCAANIQASSSIFLLCK